MMHDVHSYAQETQTEPNLFKDVGALIDDPGKFAQCTIDCASEVLGVDTAAKAGVAASGLNVLPASGKPGGATRKMENRENSEKIGDRPQLRS